MWLLDSNCKGMVRCVGPAPPHSISCSPSGVFSVTLKARTTKLLRETTVDGFALKMRFAPGPLKVTGRLCICIAMACILPGVPISTLETGRSDKNQQSGAASH